MFCSKCGKELPDDSVFCSACGHQIGEVMKTKPVAKEKPKKEKKPVNKKALKKAAIISGAVLGVLIFLGIVVFLVIPSIAHSKAEKLYNNCQYAEAYRSYIDAYHKPMNGFVTEDEITNCGLAAIDAFIQNGDAEGAFEFVHQYSMDSDYEGGWIISHIVYQLNDRNPDIITDDAVQKKLSDNIVKIIGDGEYCVFDEHNINAYTDEYLFEHDIRLLLYMISALPTDDSNFCLPTEIYAKLLQSYTVSYNRLSAYRVRSLFPQEKLDAYIVGFAESCGLDSQLTYRCKDRWMSDYEITSTEISNIQIKYKAVEPTSSDDEFVIRGLTMLTYKEHTYSENFSLSYTWDSESKSYKEGFGVCTGFYVCDESGEIVECTFSSTISFTRFEGYGQAKVVLEFDGNTLRKKTYGYNGTLSDTDTASYSMIVTPTDYTITATFFNGLEAVMRYDVNSNFIAWGEKAYVNIN